MKPIHDLKEPTHFSLILGGPLFQLLLRLRLITPTLDLLQKRIIFITLFAWLPLLILSAIEGNAWGGIEVPFLYDIETQARFLIALPLLIIAELLVHKRLRQIVGEFIERNMIIYEELPQFRESIKSAIRLRNSITAELVLLILVYVLGHYLWTSVNILESISSNIEFWYSAKGSSHKALSLAGYWSFFVARPLFQFMLLRWYYRLFIWARFLWQCSRLELNLIPTHPDRAGGLEFLSMSSSAFAPLIAAHGILLAGIIANSIFFGGEKLTDFTILITSIVVFLLLIVLGPLLVFSSQLMHCKRTGIREYGILASRYVSEFDNKWIRGGAPDDESLIGSSDIQSLADLGNSFQVIREIQPFPFNKYSVIHVIAFTLIPVLPLVLTMIPLEQLIEKFFEVIF